MIGSLATQILDQQEYDSHGPSDSDFLHFVAIKMEEQGRILMARGALNGKLSMKTAARIHSIAARLQRKEGK